jgi:hypothetical protein
MEEKVILIDVSDLLQKTPMIFHGKTFVSKNVHDQIIEPTENKYALIDNPEQRLLKLVTGGNIGESVEIHTHRPGHDVRHFIYNLHTLDGDRLFHVKCKLNYFEGNGVLITTMEDEELP